MTPSLPPVHIPTVPYYEGNERPVDFRRYLYLLKKNINLFITFLIVGVTLVAIYASRLPNRYQASAQILLERPKQSGGQAGMGAVYMPDIWQEDYYTTQKEIITSPTVLRMVVDELKLTEYFHVKSLDDAASILKGYVRVDRVRGARLFNIYTHSTDPMFSMTLANAVARAYIRKNFEDLLYFSKEILNWVPQRGKDVLTVEDPFGKVRQVSRQDLIESLPSVQTDPTIRALQEKKTFLEAELTTLLKQYREKHPLVVKARAGHRFLKESVEAETKRVIESLQQQAEGKAQVSNARIVEEAEMPTAPSGPQRLRMILQAAFIEFIALFLFVILWDHFDDTIHSPDDLTRKGIALAFLGPVPLIKDIEATGEEKFLITHFKPRSSTSESFRYLRVAINFSAPAETLKNLVFTSSLPSEGKSFVANNIAISLAQDGNRTLIVDADLRRPVAQRVYKMENQAGLSNFLTSEIDVETIIRTTFVENLSVVLSGPASPNPAEILASKKMGQLLHAIYERFDRIIIDAPPVTGMGDALVLGSLTSHVVFVVRAGKTPAEIIRQSAEIVEKNGIRIIGAVLNQVDIEKERHGGYYQYYYKSYNRYYGNPEKQSE